MNLESDKTGSIDFVKTDTGGVLNLNGHKMTIDEGGINVDTREWAVINGEGVLTSNRRYLDIFVSETSRTRKDDTSYTGLVINAVIADSNNKVGLRVSGSRDREGIVYLKGSKSNTFTGGVEVLGRRNYLALRKTNGAIAVRGNISVRDYGLLRLDEAGQIERNSVVTLSKGTFYFSSEKNVLAEKFHQLVVDRFGTVTFDYIDRDHANRYLYLDDLIIGSNGQLRVLYWKEGRDYLLVRKDSKHLADALKKISFEGYAPGQVHLEEFNREYWAISGAPEPSTYGAVFAGAGMALEIWCRRKLQQKRTA